MARISARRPVLDRRPGTRHAAARHDRPGGPCRPNTLWAMPLLGPCRARPGGPMANFSRLARKVPNPNSHTERICSYYSNILCRTLILSTTSTKRDKKKQPTPNRELAIHGTPRFFFTIFINFIYSMIFAWAGGATKVIVLCRVLHVYTAILSVMMSTVRDLRSWLDP
jgi:plasmid maintenance system killer protein